MQIHELNNYVGDLDATAFLAVDNGNDTGKVSATDFLSDVNSEINQVNNDLNDRIDNIIAGGDAPSEAEIIDARHGASELGGANYASLGAAIRGQAKILKDCIDSIAETINDDFIEITANAILDSGLIDARSKYRMVVYSVNPNTQYHIKNPQGAYLRIGSSATLSYSQTLTDFITPPDNTDAFFITAPNAKYMYVVYWNQDDSSVTYQTAAASLETTHQIANDKTARAELEAAFDNAIAMSRNLYDPEKYCRLGDGMNAYGNIIGAGGYADRCVVHLIPVDGLSFITIAVLSNTNTSHERYCWYDEDKNPITLPGQATAAIGTYPFYGVKRATYIEVPASAKYVSFMLFYSSCVLDDNGYPKCMVTPTKGYIGYKPYNTTEPGIEYSRPKDIYVCAKDSDEKYRIGCDYYCPGINDESVLQTALEAVGTVGTLWLAPGHYSIDSIPLRDDGQYCALQYKINNRGRVRIKCFDQTPMRENGYSDINRCAVLVVSAACYSSLDNATEYNIIGVERDLDDPSADDGRIWNGACFDLSGIGVEIPGNQKEVIAFNAYYAFCMMMERCMCTAIPFNGMPMAAGNENCIGIQCTMGSNFGQCSQLTSCAAYGFGQGIAVLGEHYVLTNCKTIYNKYGYTFNWRGNNRAGYIHPNTLINCCSEMDFNYPYFGFNDGRQPITMIDFNMEYRTAAAALGGALAQEAIPGTWRGDIHFTIKAYGSEGFSGGNEVGFAFWESGHGDNVHTVNDAQKQIVTTAERESYAPNQMQRVFDSTEGKFYTYINGAWVEG